MIPRDLPQLSSLLYKIDRAEIGYRDLNLKDGIVELRYITMT